MADTKGIDIDAVREIETDSDGVTIRVVYNDADDESDQVGFQVTRPPGRFGQQMFQERLSDGFRELRRHLNGESTDDDSTTDTSATETHRVDDSVVEDESSTSTDSATTTHRVDVTTALSEDSLEGLRGELDELIDELLAESPDAERMADIEDRLDEVDTRLTRLEEQLSMLGNGPD